MSESKVKEFARFGILGLAAAWLLHPFATTRMYGAGDALWYEHMLADYLTQLRAGVFPIFAGESEFAFNGAVYPLRVAPMYQHLAGLLDLLTGRTLGFILLQHLTVIVCGIVGLYACYLTLCRIAPSHRWSAAGFAILYLSCPGILGTIYTQDLYMTWMTVPLAPLAVYGIVRTFRTDDVASQFWFAVPLAALWWAHAPIALWFTFIGGMSQLVRLIGLRRHFAPFKRAVLGVFIFGLLVQYPFVSVAEIKTPGLESTVVGTLAHPEKLMDFVRGVFPANLMPVSDHARELSDLQLGYSYWAILICAAAAAIRTRRADLTVLVAASGALLLLVIPVPGITSAFWSVVPSAVVRITYYWPMQRFYLIVSALLAAAGQMSFDGLSMRNRRVGAILGPILAAGCIWSLWESRQFIRGAAERTATEGLSERIQRSENLTLMDHAYGLFDTLPPNFTNGVVDPHSAAQLRSWLTGGAISDESRRIVLSGVFKGTADPNPGVLDLSPTFHLKLGYRYKLDLTFAQRELSGILQLLGHSLVREYSLPSSGERLAFGDGPENSHMIDLWTTNPSGDDITIRFIPMGRRAKAADFTDFGSFKFYEIDATKSSIQTTSLIPFEATVTTKVRAFLETPRMFIPGYRAVIDNQRTAAIRSNDGLVEVAVDPGIHKICLIYIGTPILRLSYWLGIVAWMALPFVEIRSRLFSKN